MEEYFGIKYSFDKENVLKRIDNSIKQGEKGYVCVADGVSLSMIQKSDFLGTVFAESLLTVCDSGWVPLFLRWIYGIDRKQYAGSDLFHDIVSKKTYKMMFLGSSDTILKSLRDKIGLIDERILSMPFTELPFCKVDDFDYAAIAREVDKENPDIVWVSLGMPKQEIFMYKLQPLLKKGVLIGIGAAFKFHSGLKGHRRAPKWMIKAKIEWVYRILSEPRKQLARCWLIFTTIPGILFKEYKCKRKREHDQ